jgi:hypothetical protein
VHKEFLNPNIFRHHAHRFARPVACLPLVDRGRHCGKL